MQTDLALDKTRTIHRSAQIVAPCPNLAAVMQRDGASATARALGMSSTALHRYLRNKAAPPHVDLAAAHILGEAKIEVRETVIETVAPAVLLIIAVRKADEKSINTLLNVVQAFGLNYTLAETQV